jgi:hypothetical protein
LHEFKILKRKQLSTQSADEIKKWEISVSLSQAKRVKICRFFDGIQATYSYIIRCFACLAHLELKRVLGHMGKEVTELQRKLHSEELHDLYS